MIRITQVQRSTGEVLLTFEYDIGLQTQSITIDNDEIIDRLKALKKLIGRTLNLTDLKNVTVTLINEIRQGKSELAERFPYESYIGVDLEQ